MMSRNILSVMTVILAGAVAAGAADEARLSDELYAPTAAADVRSRAMQWVAGRQIRDEAVLEAIGAVWSWGDAKPPARALFESVIDTFRLADPEVAALVAACDLGDASPTVPAFQPFASAADSFFRTHLTVYFGRYLAQRQMYDEALELLAPIDPAEVVDPAECLFYRAVCEHQLLLQDEGLKTLTTLLENTVDVPAGYTNVARLMKFELEQYQAESLDEVARRMRDSERRLKLGRGGEKVQEVQERIVSLLDDIIDKVEQQSGGGGGAAGSPGNQSANPADDSRVKGATAPGDVDKKKLSNRAGWGALPPKEEARAKNLINRNFPSHYRQAVEEYFKKLASRRANTQTQP